jgi:hypothetical protein
MEVRRPVMAPINALAIEPDMDFLPNALSEDTKRHRAVIAWSEKFNAAAGGSREMVLH